MFEAFYGLSQVPFSRDIPTGELYKSVSLEETLGRLQYAAERKWFAVITGDCGTISIPKRGKKSKERTEHERTRWFRQLQRRRAGGEGTISVLKRSYSLGKSLSRGHRDVSTWVGFGILTYNLRRLAALR